MVSWLSFNVILGVEVRGEVIFFQSFWLLLRCGSCWSGVDWGRGDCGGLVEERGVEEVGEMVVETSFRQISMRVGDLGLGRGIFYDS